MGLLGDIFGSNSRGKNWSVQGSRGSSSNYGEQESTGSSSSSASSQSSGDSYTSSRGTSSSTGISQSEQRSSNQSGNLNLGLLNTLFGGVAANGETSGRAIMNMLGLNGAEAQEGAQEMFRNTPGYQFLQDEGARAVNANYAGRGALLSGAAMKALQDRAMGIADNTVQNYMKNLFDVGTQAQGAGTILSGAGQYGTGQSAGTSGSVNVSDSLNTSSGASTQRATSAQNSVSNQSSRGFQTGQSDSASWGESRGKTKSGSGLFGTIASLF